MSPLGETMGTFSKMISSPVSMTSPRPDRTALNRQRPTLDDADVGRTPGVVALAGGADLALLKVALLDGLHRVEQLADARGIPRELGKVLVAVHDPAERIGRREQEPPLPEISERQRPESKGRQTFVMKPWVRPPMSPVSVTPGTLKKTGRAQMQRPRLPQTHLMMPSSTMPCQSLTR